ncbi:zinc ribbon domain-containing protein [Streptomyces graminilatus]|uniref:zinc ribbon domain-containing protein n=1 Tax=Streptomyces graminilatus TaxID=1464070 RepID=UPI0006E1ED76|nr:zinc ribbon domain-containing protein [Streptomyces graminilatus]
MATCEQCGAPQEGGDDFCGACGAFTAWRRERTATASATASTDGERSGEEAAEADAPATTSGSPATTETPVATTVAPPPVAPVAPVAPAASAVPAPEQTTGPVLPATPTLERVERRRGAVDGHVRAPDDVECAGCGTANPAGRRFCRRCGSALDAPAAEVSASWWQRLTHRLREGRRRRRLGRRSGGWATARRAIGVLVVLGVLGGGVYAAVPYVSRLLGDARDRVAETTPVTPKTVKASSSATGHPAAYAADGTWTNWWAPRNPAKGQWVEAEFSGAFDLLHLVVLSGASGERQDDFLKQARPSVCELKAWVAGGRTVTRRIELQDKYGPQDFELAIKGVTRVRLTITSAYGEAPRRLTAVGELEFRRRR